MLVTRFVRVSFILLVVLCLSAIGVRAADILFVTAEDDPVDAEDTVIISFLGGLGHNVILIDDSEDEPTTEAAALAADLVFISESVNSGDIRTEITEVETPMIITEAWGWDEMGLTGGSGSGIAVASTNINIVNPGHFLAAGLRGTVPVLTMTGSARFALGIAGSQATVIARAALSDGQTYDVLYVYEKGAALPVAPADGSAQVAAEMRICFGFDELSYSVWNENAYALLAAAVKYALGITNQARNPKPSDGQEDIAQQALLSWTPIENARTHNLYFGTTFEDVNAADIGSPLLVGPGLDVNSYDPGILELGQTYYWRVDEVGATPESVVYKGNIWSFEVEPFAYPVSGENIFVTASSYAENQEPENTINGSGLVGDLHSSETTAMWVTAEGDAGPPWIQYEFDKVYKLDRMTVWNYNGQSYLAALGINEVTIEYSADGVNWILLDGTFTFPKAPGKNGYASDITVDFDGTPVKLVKINPVSNWLPAFAQYGLSEVRFLYIPVRARQPDP